MRNENKDKIPYLVLNLTIVEDGSVVNIISKNIELIKLELFSKHIANFDLSSNKYGLKLSIDSID